MVSLVFLSAGTGISAVETKMRPMLRLHNTDLLQCCHAAKEWLSHQNYLA